MSAEVSFIIPTLNEEECLKDCLESIEKQSTQRKVEVIVVDGGSEDKTLEIAENYETNIIEDVKGRGRGRDKGAQEAEGKYLFFLDADTRIKSRNYVDRVICYIEDQDYVAASTQFYMNGYRAKIMQIFCNLYFPRKRKPLLPGFNTIVKEEAYDKQGFEDVMGEDLQFSKRIAQVGDTGILKEKMVVNSDRRIRKIGLTGILFYYTFKDMARRLSNKGLNLWSPSKYPI